VKIPQLLIEKATPVINKIAENRQNKNIFAYYDKQDIYQEIWSLCLDALSRYKPENGKLENFLNKHVSHRIKNLKRDKYFRPEKDPSLSKQMMNRINIVNALPIGDSDISNIAKPISQSNKVYDPVDYCISMELQEYLIENLPDDFKGYFKLLISGHKIKKRILLALRENVSILIRKFNGE